MRENCPDDLLRIAALSQNPRSLRGVLAVRGVLGVGPALVIEVVQQGSPAPGLVVGAVPAGISAHTGFHRQHVLSQAFRLRELTNKVPGVFASRHRSSSGNRMSLPHKGTNAWLAPGAGKRLLSTTRHVSTRKNVRN